MLVGYLEDLIEEEEANAKEKVEDGEVEDRAIEEGHVVHDRLREVHLRYHRVVVQVEVIDAQGHSELDDLVVCPVDVLEGLLI